MSDTPIFYSSLRIPCYDLPPRAARMVVPPDPANWIARRVEYSSLSNNLFAVWSFATAEDKAAHESNLLPGIRTYLADGCEKLFQDCGWTRNPNLAP